MMGCSIRRRPSRRRGVGTLQLILVLPVILVVLLALFEFTMLMVLKSAVTHAATVAAREAGKDADIDELAEVVQAVVAANCITIGDTPGCGTKIVLEAGDGAITEYGDTDMNCTLPANAVGPDEVRVTVCVATDATGLGDWLEDFGFSILGRCLKASSLVKREHS